MRKVLIYGLPTVPDVSLREVHWWLVSNGQIETAGNGPDWVDLIGEDRDLIALAPAGAARVTRSASPPTTSSVRQAAAVARVAALDASLGDDEANHVVSSAGDGGVVTAIVDNGVMLAWLDWARGFGADPSHIVPVAALLPNSEDWTAATIGSERIVGKNGLIVPDEPALRELIVGDSDVRELAPEEVERALVRIADEIPIDLRSGRFARRRGLVIERDRVRELALLAAALVLITLAWAVLGVLKLNNETDRLNEETLLVAQAALGRPVALETAESALAQSGGGSVYGGLMPPLTALYDALRTEDQVSATAINFSPDGTLATTLAAPTADPVNRVLVALQRSGYSITAVPRKSSDGRTMSETTIRSGS